MGNFLSAFDISSSALSAQKTRMEIISQNIANADTIITDSGEPYRRKYTTFETSNKSTAFYDCLTNESRRYLSSGVKVSSIKADQTPFSLEYRPDSPYADENGYVSIPNVDITQEMLDLISATRSYEANITALNISKNLLMKAFEIGE